MVQDGAVTIQFDWGAFPSSLHETVSIKGREESDNNDLLTRLHTL